MQTSMHGKIVDLLASAVEDAGLAHQFVGDAMLRERLAALPELVLQRLCDLARTAARESDERIVRTAADPRAQHLRAVEATRRALWEVAQATMTAMDQFDGSIVITTKPETN